MSVQPTFIELPSEPMQNIYRTVRQVATSDLSFFITGETGVGKEAVAQYIHKSGPRRNKPLVAINCGRFTTELLQSELFGHEEGAFTGASRSRRGAFETVNDGILFLDEITEMPLEAQKTFLRVLDTKTFTRIGGNESLTTDFQIISATNRDIGKDVLETKFRADLYYRLMDMCFHIPPLRERPEDIAPLVDAFIDEFSSERGKGAIKITAEALTRLEKAAWPGNIRQLRSSVRTAVALTTTDKLEVKDFPYNFFTAPGLENPVSAPDRADSPAVHTEFTQTIPSIWHTLPEKVQQAVVHELSEHLPELSGNVPTANTAPTDENPELLNIKDMDQQEILQAVAQKRIAEYASLNDAAHSLGIDIRTLQKHAHWQAQNDTAEGT